MARSFVLLALLALIVAGCDPGASAKKQMEGTRAPDWPALKAMNGQGGLMTVGMAMDTQGPKAAQEAAASPAFTQLLDNFDLAAIPSEFSTAEREAAKKAFVESLRAIAKGGSDEDLKAHWQKVRDSMGIIGRP